MKINYDNLKKVIATGFVIIGLTGSVKGLDNDSIIYSERYNETSNIYTMCQMIYNSINYYPLVLAFNGFNSEKDIIDEVIYYPTVEELMKINDKDVSLYNNYYTDVYFMVNNNNFLVKVNDSIANLSNMYVVKENDTFFSIAHDLYGDATLGEILFKLNYLYNDGLVVNQVIYTPSKEAISRYVMLNNSLKEGTTLDHYYVCENGDNFKIATLRMFSGFDYLEDVKDKNGFYNEEDITLGLVLYKPNIIKQKVSIPDEYYDYSYKYVLENENISEVISKFNLNMNYYDFLTFNGISDECYPYCGMTLYIPSNEIVKNLAGIHTVDVVKNEEFVK